MDLLRAMKVLEISKERNILDNLHVELVEAYEKYRDILIKIAFRLLSDKPLAEDIVHDVFVCMLKSRSKFCQHPNKEALLIISVKNRIKNEYKKRMRDNNLLEFLKQIYETEFIEAFDLEGYYTLLNNYLNSKEAILLYDFYIQGKPIEIICGELQISRSGVKMRISRAKKKLLNEMGLRKYHQCS